MTLWNFWIIVNYSLEQTNDRLWLCRFGELKENTEAGGTSNPYIYYTLSQGETHQDLLVPFAIASNVRLGPLSSHVPRYRRIIWAGYCKAVQTS